MVDVSEPLDARSLRLARSRPVWWLGSGVLGDDERLALIAETRPLAVVLVQGPGLVDRGVDALVFRLGGDVVDDPDLLRQTVDEWPTDFSPARPPELERPLILILPEDWDTAAGPPSACAEGQVENEGQLEDDEELDPELERREPEHARWRQALAALLDVLGQRRAVHVVVQPEAAATPALLALEEWDPTAPRLEVAEAGGTSFFEAALRLRRVEAVDRPSIGPGWPPGGVGWFPVGDHVDVERVALSLGHDVTLIERWGPPERVATLVERFHRATGGLVLGPGVVADHDLDRLRRELEVARGRGRHEEYFEQSPGRHVVICVRARHHEQHAQGETWRRVGEWRPDWLPEAADGDHVWVGVLGEPRDPFERHEVGREEELDRLQQGMEERDRFRRLMERAKAGDGLRFRALRGEVKPEDHWPVFQLREQDGPFVIPSRDLRDPELLRRGGRPPNDRPDPGLGPEVPFWQAINPAWRPDVVSRGGPGPDEVRAWLESTVLAAWCHVVTDGRRSHAVTSPEQLPWPPAWSGVGPGAVGTAVNDRQISRLFGADAHHDKLHEWLQSRGLTIPHHHDPMGPGVTKDARNVLEALAVCTVSGVDVHERTLAALVELSSEGRDPYEFSFTESPPRPLPPRHVRVRAAIERFEAAGVVRCRVTRRGLYARVLTHERARLLVEGRLAPVRPIEAAIGELNYIRSDQRFIEELLALLIAGAGASSRTLEPTAVSWRAADQEGDPWPYWLTPLDQADGADERGRLVQVDLLANATPRALQSRVVHHVRALARLRAALVAPEEEAKTLLQEAEIEVQRAFAEPWLEDGHALGHPGLLLGTLGHVEYRLAALEGDAERAFSAARRFDIALAELPRLPAVRLLRARLHLASGALRAVTAAASKLAADEVRRVLREGGEARNLWLDPMTLAEALRLLAVAPQPAPLEHEARAVRQLGERSAAASPKWAPTADDGETLLRAELAGDDRAVADALVDAMLRRTPASPGERILIATDWNITRRHDAWERQPALCRRLRGFLQDPRTLGREVPLGESPSVNAPFVAELAQLLDSELPRSWERCELEEKARPSSQADALWSIARLLDDLEIAPPPKAGSRDALAWLQLRLWDDDRALRFPAAWARRLAQLLPGSHGAGAGLSLAAALLWRAYGAGVQLSTEERFLGAATVLGSDPLDLSAWSSGMRLTAERLGGAYPRARSTHEAARAQARHWLDELWAVRAVDDIDSRAYLRQAAAVDIVTPRSLGATAGSRRDRAP